MRGTMTWQTAALLVGVVGLAGGCNRAGNETGRNVDAADTMVTTRQVPDTTIITRDTQVTVDTIRKEGDKNATRADTVKRTGGAAGATGADTTAR
jgi:hypothetical protein